MCRIVGYPTIANVALDLSAQFIHVVCIELPFDQQTSQPLNNSVRRSVTNRSCRLVNRHLRHNVSDDWPETAGCRRVRMK